MAIDFFVEDFIVGDGGLQERVPVDEPLAAIDQAVLEHLEERMPDGLRADVIEREANASPVAAGSDRLELADDAFFVGVLPFPDAFDESLAADVVAGEPLFFVHPAFDDRLRGDAGMIGAGHPEGLESLHPLPAGDEILTGAVQGMPHVQRPRDVGERDHDRVRRLAPLFDRWLRIGIEVAMRLPIREPRRLGLLGIVLLGNFGHG